MPLQPQDLSRLPPHDWNKMLAKVWEDKKKHSKDQWQQHATAAVHRAIMHRQSLFLAMVMEPLNYGWCRCVDGQIVLFKPWSADDYLYDPSGYGCVDLGGPPEPGEAPVPLCGLEWPTSWLDWEFVKSVFYYGQAISRYGHGNCANQLFWMDLCLNRYPNRWNQELGDLLCQTLYDFPQFPSGEAIAAYRTKRMQQGDPAQPNMLDILTATEGAQCPNFSSRPKSKPSSKSPISSASSTTAGARTQTSRSTPSGPTTKGLRQLQIFDWLGQIQGTNGSKPNAGPPPSNGSSGDPPTTASP